MTFRSLTPRFQPPGCNHGVHHQRGALVVDERDPMLREHGRAARLTTIRRYLGIDRNELGLLLGVRGETSLRAWEAGRDPIPVPIWGQLQDVLDRFDAEVEKLVEQAAAVEGDRVKIRVWRGRSDHQPLPQWWQRIVSEAMRTDPRIEPVFPDDDEDN